MVMNKKIAFKKNKVSILITCYNQAEYIEQAIESILSQKVNFAYEIIVGDDGSSDGSYELLQQRYGKNSNIKFFQMPRGEEFEKNATIRASELRVKLLKQVSGEYFAYLDGDDFYCDDLKFQTQIDILDDASNAECVCCADNSYFYYSNDKKQAITSEKLKSGIIPLKDYWYSYWFHASNCVFRSSIISTFPDQILGKVFHDNMITFWALQHGKLYYHDAVTMCYRQVVKDSIWTKNKEIVRHVRQVISADVCNQLAPNLWFCTYYRNRISYEYLYHFRGKENENLSEYIQLAEELNCKDTLQLVCFEKQGAIKKLLIRMKHIFLCKFCYYKALKMN